jgi:hypothetical protein
MKWRKLPDDFPGVNLIFAGVAAGKCELFQKSAFARLSSRFSDDEISFNRSFVLRQVHSFPQKVLSQ